MSVSGDILSHEALSFLCNCINNTVNLSKDIVLDTAIQTSSTYSSFLIENKLKQLKEENETYANSLVAGLNKLSKEVINDKSLVTQENILYLYKSDDDTSNNYMQMMLINGVSVELGTTEVDISTLYSKDECDSKFGAKLDLDTLTTSFNELKTTLGTDGLNTTSQTVTGAINELKSDKVNRTDIVDNLTSTDTDKPLSANQGKVLKDEVNLKANDDEVIKKADIKTTLDENSTNDDVCRAKAIFDAIKKNCIGKETVLYEGSISATGTYTLADDVNNYDFIVINHTHNSTIYRQSNVLTKSEISKCIDKNNKFLCVYGDGSASIYTTGYFNNNNVIISDYNNEIITSITGYKFGEVTVQNTITNPLQPISYSTDEQLTGGTWIDGKPIYRKSWTGTGNPNSFNHNIDSLGDVIKIDGCFSTSTSQWMNFTGSDSSGDMYLCRAVVTPTQIVFTLKNYTITKYTLSVEYTKTTD